MLPTEQAAPLPGGQTKMLPAIVSYYEHLNYFKASRLPIK